MIRTLTALLFLPTLAAAQPDLHARILAAAAPAQGKVAVACALPGVPLDCALAPASTPPMQSVFKLPLAVAALHQVEQGTLTLDQPIRFLKSDLLPQGSYSPLQDKYPTAEADIPLRELLRLSVSLSDNAAADVVLRIVGGSAVVDRYIASLGVQGFVLKDNENVLHRELMAQYRNTFQPQGAVQLLRRISDVSPLNPEHSRLLLEWMVPSMKATRIKAGVPVGVTVMHKSGTSDVTNGLAHATNDIGLITMPDGRRLALAIFITDSRADDKTRDTVIAEIARAIYDAAIAAKP